MENGVTEKPVHVYAARCIISSKIYVGVTNNFKLRKSQHKSKANTGRRTVFYNAIRKYGWDNFEWCIIESVPTRAAANEIEQYWINYFKSNVRAFGYNMTEGGEGVAGFSLSVEARRKISEFQKGRLVSLESRKRQSESRKGCRPSEEVRRKLSEAHTGLRCSEETKQKMRNSQRRRRDKEALLKENLNE